MIELGRHSYACEPEFRGNMSKVIVGNYTSIARGVVFDCGFQHPVNTATTFPLNKIWPELPGSTFTKGDIKIGNNCWIGENAMIMSGIEIGDGCIVGAGEVVRRKMPAFTKYVNGDWWSRYFKGTDRDADKINKLLDIAWWNWPDERVLKNAHLLLSEDINNFIENYI